ncbi:ATP-binding cassette domain-containing protein [Rhodococcus sp. X156]|uniref:ATP-binding cassette domain-containing protein n=1 Tax=Rhodococcus sp. X156 TaxID=2499145 RepID=UPI0013E2F6FA|nr:ATP-binding cassette domain-containing protein [Rhodococcus sp. X156]
MTRSLSAGRSAPPSVTVQVQSLSKTFRAGPAVRQLSFAVHPGTVCALVGPAGSGKSTTVRALLGLVTPTSGSVTLTGAPVGALPRPGRTVGAVLDPRGMRAGHTLRQHLLVTAAAIGVPDRRVEEVLATVGLAPMASRRVGPLPPPGRLRLALAAALLGDPPLLVLDEPLRELPPPEQRWLTGVLRTHAAGGGTVLLTAERAAGLEQAVDQLVVLHDGACTFQGSTRQLLAGMGSRVLVASSNAAGLARALVHRGVTDVVWVPDGRIAVRGARADDIVAVARDAGITVRHVQQEHPDLDQAVRAHLDSGSPAPRRTA